MTKRCSRAVDQRTTSVLNNVHMLPAHFLLDNVVLEFSHLGMLTGVRRSDTLFSQSCKCTVDTGGILYLTYSLLVIGRFWYLCMCGIRVVYKYTSNHGAKNAMMEMLSLNCNAECMCVCWNL